MSGPSSGMDQDLVLVLDEGSGRASMSDHTLLLQFGDLFCTQPELAKHF